MREPQKCVLLDLWCENDNDTLQMIILNVVIIEILRLSQIFHQNLPFNSLGWVTFLIKDVFYVHQGCIYLKNTAEMLKLLLQFK